MTTPGRARPLPADQRRAAIAAAALPLVLAHGRAVTTRQIAAAAGVAEGTIFHVFADKEAVITAVVDQVMQPGQVVAELRAIDLRLSLHERIVLIVEVLRRRMTEVFALMTALGMVRPPEPAGHGAPDGSPDQATVRSGRLRELTDEIAALLAPDAADLRYPPAETTQLIRLFTFAASHPAITDHQPLPATQIAAVLLGGITTHAHCHVGTVSTRR